MRYFRDSPECHVRFCGTHLIFFFNAWAKTDWAKGFLVWASYLSITTEWASMYQGCFRILINKKDGAVGFFQILHLWSIPLQSSHLSNSILMTLRSSSDDETSSCNASRRLLYIDFHGVSIASVSSEKESVTLWVSTNNWKSDHQKKTRAPRLRRRLLI